MPDGDIFPMAVSLWETPSIEAALSFTLPAQTVSGRPRVDLAAARVRGAGLTGLVVIGGDGSLRGMVELCNRGVKAIGIPGTIDNDLAYTDYTIGFDTAVNTGVEAVNRLRDTATSHERVFVVETMGRHEGHLALAVGVAGGAESILIPELPVNIEEICDKLKRGLARGKVHSIIVVAEGAASGFDVAKQIEMCLGMELRVTVLGHVQRGGTPTAFDRLLASRMGAKAVDLLLKGQSNLMVGVSGTRLIATPTPEVLAVKRELDLDLYNLAQDLAR